MLYCVGSLLSLLCKLLNGKIYKIPLYSDDTMNRNYLTDLRKPELRPSNYDGKIMSDIEYVALVVKEAMKKEDMEQIVEDYEKFLAEKVNPDCARKFAEENIAIVVCGLEADVEAKIQYEQWCEVLDFNSRVLAQGSASILDILDWAAEGNLTLRMKSYE